MGMTLTIPGLESSTKQTKEVKPRPQLVFAMVVGSSVLPKLEPSLADGSVAAWVDGQVEVPAARPAADGKSVRFSSRKERKYAEELWRIISTASEAAAKRRRVGGVSEF